jgi:hypothetical protein
VRLEPTLFDSAPDARTELCAASFKRVEERIVDLLDVDAAVLDRLDARRQLDELPGGSLRIGKRAFGDVFHCWNQASKISVICLEVEPAATERIPHLVQKPNQAMRRFTLADPHASFDS